MTLGYRLPSDGKPIEIPAAVAARAHDRYVLNEDGCHISTYSTASHGYAQIGWQDAPGHNRGVTAHRASWVHVHGQIPVGMTVDHICRVRRCVNVHHLRLLSNRANASDNGQVRLNPGIGRFCHKGHELTQTATYQRTYCRECKAARKRERRAAGEKI